MPLPESEILHVTVHDLAYLPSDDYWLDHLTTTALSIDCNLYEDARTLDEESTLNTLREFRHVTALQLSRFASDYAPAFVEALSGGELFPGL